MSGRGWLAPGLLMETTFLILYAVAPAPNAWSNGLLLYCF